MGGWVIDYLLQRGEEPTNIRVIDFAPTPVNYVVSDAISLGLQYVRADITDAKAVSSAFGQPWPDRPNHISDGITVIHNAAAIRFFERHTIFLPRSTAVNVDGLRNCLEAAKAIGVDIFILTSSASVAVRPRRLLLWPWEKEPKGWVQIIDDSTKDPETHEECFSNYAASKLIGERLVLNADGSPVAGGKIMRTGSIRPANGVYGPRGDIVIEAYLVRKSNPTWVQNCYSNFCSVENAVLAHLLYERRLLDLVEQDKMLRHDSPLDNPARPRLPDIGGQSFIVSDPGRIGTFGDNYAILQQVTGGECHFINISPTLMFILAHIHQLYNINQYRLISFLQQTSWLAWLVPLVSTIFPTVTGDGINLQPSLFYLTSAQLFFDDSRARKSPEQGGLGYEGLYSTPEGVLRTVDEFYHGRRAVNGKGMSAGLSLEFLKPKGTKRNAVVKIPRKAGRVVNREDELPVAPVEVL